MILVVLLKLSLISIFLSAELKSSGYDYKKIFLKKDYDEQINPTNNLIETGTWELEKFSNEPFVQRLPGYILPYGLFRYFFNEKVSVHLLIIFQISLSILASFYLFLTILSISNNFIISCFGFTIFNLFFFITYWELSAVPESLSVSYYVLFIYS